MADRQNCRLEMVVGDPFDRRFDNAEAGAHDGEPGEIEIDGLLVAREGRHQQAVDIAGAQNLEAARR